MHVYFKRCLLLGSMICYFGFLSAQVISAPSTAPSTSATPAAQTAAATPSQSAAQSALPDTIRAIVSKFKTLITQYPQEKVYLHHDKSFYTAGDQIWLRGYLVNATSHIPNRLSRLMYVELLNKHDTILHRIKLVAQNGEFYGDIDLPDTLSPGYYRLRAYTNFMRNAGDEFFYNEPIYVGNSRSFKMMSNVSWSMDENKNIVGTVNFKNLNQQPIANSEVEYTLYLKNKSSKKQTTNQSGDINVGFRQSDLDEDQNLLQVTLTIDGVAYKRTFKVPSVSDDIDLQFFPEGGWLLADRDGTVAFKAIDANGMGKQVSGMVYDASGNEMIDFESNALGMGKFRFKPEKGVKYYAEVKTDVMTKRVDLPEAQVSGIVLNAGQSASRVTLMIQATDDVKNSTDQWLLLLHSRGALLNAVMVTKDQLGIAIPVPKEQLPSGIVTFTLCNANGPVSERLVFVNNPLDQLKISITADKPSYEKRERVALTIKVTDSKGTPVQTNLSLAVTDDAIVNPDDMLSTIYSNLLLSSDLKGYIETPHYYFSDSLGVRDADLDYLMMTQGWSRFNVNDVLHGQFPDLEYPLELSSSISGTVRSLTGIARNANLTLLVPTANSGQQIYSATSDDKGHFIFSGFENPDSTEYVIQARSTGGGQNMFVTLDSDFVPVSPFQFQETNKEATPLFQNYLKRSYEQFMYDVEGQMLVLEGVAVEANAVIEKTGDAVIDMITSGMSYYSPHYFDAAKIEELAPGYTFWQLLDLASLYYVSEQDRKIQIRANRSMPLILVDGFTRDLQYVESFVHPTEIDKLIIIRDGNEAAFWGNYAFQNGAIYITMKRGEPNQEASSPGVSVVTPLGYYVGKDFYVPNYSVDEELKNKEPDLRTTVYWSPLVATDQTGTAIVAFYAADDPTTYSVVTETISSGGFIGRARSTVERK